MNGHLGGTFDAPSFLFLPDVLEYPDFLFLQGPLALAPPRAQYLHCNNIYIYIIYIPSFHEQPDPIAVNNARLAS